MVFTAGKVQEEWGQRPFPLGSPKSASWAAELRAMGICAQETDSKPPGLLP